MVIKLDTVHAFAIDDIHICVKLPDGTINRFGSARNLKNRIEHRGVVDHTTKYEYDTIIIDDDTLRCEVSNSGRPIKKSFKKYENWNN